MSINLKNKSTIVKKFGANEKDTGSTKVQIALLTEQINAFLLTTGIKLMAGIVISYYSISAIYYHFT